MTRRRDGRLTVALHDIEPENLERCALIREWLSDLGVDRVTLVVRGRSPAVSEWLSERRACGDAVARAEAPARRRGLGPSLLRGAGATLRVDVRPSDLDGGLVRTRALERMLRRAAAHRRAVNEADRLPLEAPGVLRAP